MRLLSFGIPETQILQLASNNIRTMANFAFICAAQPASNQDDGIFLKALSDALGLTGPDQINTGHKTAYRRAWFESATVAAAEMRALVEKTDDTPVKMPQPEKVARLKAQQAWLNGIKIEANLEPSHQLLDQVWQMRNDDTCRYLSPEVCTSRTQEAGGIKKETFIKADSAGQIHTVQKEEAQQADLSTEYRVRQALTRRALAFDNIGLMSFDKLEAYHEYSYSLVMTEALPTHFPITVDQVLRADKQLWMRLIQLTRDGILPLATPVAGGSALPLENMFAEAKLDPLFNAALQPLPKPSAGPIRDRSISSFQLNWGPYQGTQKSGKGGKGEKSDKGGKGGKSGGKWGGKGAKFSGKNGKGGSGKPSKDGRVFPDELKGLRTSTNSGRP